MKRCRNVCLFPLVCIFSLIILGGCGGESNDDSRAVSPADDDDAVADDDAADDDTLDDDDLTPDDDDDVADDDDNDDDNDNDDDQTQTICDFTVCATLESRLPIAYKMLDADQTYCGSLTSDMTFAELLRIDDLLAARGSTQVSVHLNEVTDLGTSIRRELVFADPTIGDFLVYVYTPVSGHPPYPTVLLTHGHGSYALEMFDQVGDALIDAGFLVVSQEVKGLTPNPPKAGHTWYDLISYRLAPFDRTAYGTMVYQTSVVLDYLETLDEIDASRLAAMGHSGGSFLSVNMLAVDDRLKGAVNDFYNAFPEPSSGYALDRPFEEIIPGLFCWGGGERVLKLTADHFNLQYDYGYPDDELSQAVADLTEQLSATASCGDSICGPGDTFSNCPGDCRDPGSPAAFTYTAEFLPYDFMDLEIMVSLAGAKYWEQAPAFAADQVDERLIERLSLERMEARLTCLPNSVADEETTFAQYQGLDRRICFGEAGAVAVRLLYPSLPADLPQAGGLVVFLTGDRIYPSTLDEADLKKRLLAGGLAVLEIDLPLVAQTDENTIEGYNLLAYGLAPESFYLWQIGQILSETRVEFACSDLPVHVYGNEAGAMLAFWLSLMDKRISKTAVGLFWPVWESAVPTPDSAGYLAAADFFTGQADLGARDDLLGLLYQSRLYVFPRLTADAETIAAFFINP